MRRLGERIMAVARAFPIPGRAGRSSIHLTPAELQEALADVRSRSADYSALWAECAASPDFIGRFAELRERVDPAKPFFFGVLANGIRFAGDARDFPCALHALFPASNVAFAQAFAARVPARSGDIVDVGANIGVVAATLARDVARAGDIVHAFEPSPSTFRLAAATVASNGLENIRLFNAAVGARTERITFFATPGNSAIASTRMHGHTFYNEWERLSVSQVSLDDHLYGQERTNVRAVKIDVEGGELEVIAGGAKVIAERMPMLSFEYTPAVQASHGWGSDDVVAALSRLGLDQFEAMAEPPFGSLAVRTLPFPLPEGVHDQVNVFATRK